MTRLCEVTWLDANFSDEYSVCDAHKVKPIIAKTAGYVSYECPEYVTVTMTVIPLEDDCVTEQIAIPRGMIKDIRELSSG